MNVTIAIEKFDPRVGGAERYCWDFAHFLQARGHGVEVICIKGVEPEGRDIRVHRLKAFRFPQALRHLSFAFLHFLRTRGMPGHVHLAVGNAFSMDVYQPRGGIHRAWLEAETRIHHPAMRKILLPLLRLMPKNAVQEALEWWVFHVSRPEVIAISNMIRDDMRRFYQYPGNRIHLIPNTVDTWRFRPENREFRQEIRDRYGLPENGFVFAFVANNPRLKGFSTLVKACQDLKGQPFKVLVIGSDNDRAREMAGRHGLSPLFVFGGHAQDMEKILPACDCLVHPAYYDACSRVVIEALASGIPAITTETNGASMYVGSKDGRVIPPDDPDALSSAMREMLLAGAGGMKPESIAAEGHDAAFVKILQVLEDAEQKKAARKLTR
jgi:UDP-glucose:(heptosyl)LPS alpha-1,3-glucosyltransferase